MNRALPAQMMVLLPSEAGHLATLALVVLAVLLTALVVYFTLRGRHVCPARKLASTPGSSCGSSPATGCCRR